MFKQDFCFCLKICHVVNGLELFQFLLRVGQLSDECLQTVVDKRYFPVGFLLFLFETAFVEDTQFRVQNVVPASDIVVFIIQQNDVGLQAFNIVVCHFLHSLRCFLSAFHFDFHIEVSLDFLEEGSLFQAERVVSIFEIYRKLQIFSLECG